MTILAVDPGNIESAYIRLENNQISAFGKITNEELLIEIDNLAYDVFVIEQIRSYGMAIGQTVLDTCVWIGRFLQAHKINPETPDGVLVPRKDIKMHFCGSMRAKDSNIRQALIDRFEPNLQPKQRPRGFLKGISADIWSALALAIYYQDTHP
jgi:hypothetical protein